MVTASRKRKSQRRSPRTRSITAKRLCSDDLTVRNLTQAEVGKQAEISSCLDGAPSCGCTYITDSDRDNSQIQAGPAQGNPGSSVVSHTSLTSPAHSLLEPSCKTCSTSRIEGDVRDSYQFNMKQIQNVYQQKVDQLEVKLTESERQREHLLELIDEKDKQIDELLEAFDEVKDIRRVVYPSNLHKPARMCLCGTYTTSLEDLPESLVLGIFAFLDAFSLQRMRRLARQWKDIHRHPGLNKTVHLYVDVLQQSARYHSHRSANFLHDLYGHCLTENTQHIIFNAGKERMELWDAFNLEDKDICASILPISPKLQRLTFKNCPLGLNHLLTLPPNIQKVHMFSVDLSENAGFLSLEQYINNFETGIRIEEAVMDLSDGSLDRQEMLLKFVNHHMPRLKKTDKLEIEQGISKVSETKRLQIISLINRREPLLKNKPDMSVRRLTVNHLRSLRPWTKLGILQIIRGVTMPSTSVPNDGPRARVRGVNSPDSCDIENLKCFVKQSGPTVTVSNVGNGDQSLVAQRAVSGSSTR